MDKLNDKDIETIIITVLQDYLNFLGDDAGSEVKLVIDEKQKHYLLIEAGWNKNRRIYGSLIHVEIIDNKIWIQHDGTEEGIANEFVKQGISPKQIVLAFKTPERRKITDFAIS